MANAFQQIGGILGDIATTAVSPPDGTAYAEGLREGYSAARAMEDAARARNLRIVSDQRVAARNRLVQPTPVDGEPGLPGQGVLGDVYGPAADLASAVLLSGDTVDLRRLGPLATPGSLEAARQAQRILGDEADATDILAANRAQAFLKGQQYDPVVTQGGIMRTRGVPLGDPAFELAVTPGESARIEQGEARTQAYVDRQGRPPAARGSTGNSGGRPPTVAQAEGAVLAQAREAIAAGADPAAVAQRLRDRGYPGLASKVYVAPIDLGE